MYLSHQFIPTLAYHPSGMSLAESFCHSKGSGEPNFDSFEVNPFMNPKQRREAEIQSLLQKLAPDMIGLGKHECDPLLPFTYGQINGYENVFRITEQRIYERLLICVYDASDYFTVHDGYRLEFRGHCGSIS
jgi:hypothetical protein